MTEQKAIVIFGEGIDSNENTLNEYLNNGWKVINMCAMPSACSSSETNKNLWYEPQCLVIIEKES